MTTSINKDKMEIAYGFNEKEAIYNFCQKHRILGNVSDYNYRKMTSPLTIGETVEIINSLTNRITITEVYNGLNLVFEKEKSDEQN